MKVTLIASTVMSQDLPKSVSDPETEFHRYHALIEGESADRLAHFAGRACYAAWDMPNSKTANDAGYLANILNQGHFSVLEHASVSFFIEDVSRALLAELTRHRHLSFSVISQRYVDYSKSVPVYPPSLEDDLLADQLVDQVYFHALDIYEELVQDLMAKGKTRKQAREAARCVLPNAAPVSMVVSGNHRAWRDVLGKRYSVHADAEIQALAIELLKQLKEIAPNSYQDFSEELFQ